MSGKKPPPQPVASGGTEAMLKKTSLFRQWWEDGKWTNSVIRFSELSKIAIRSLSAVYVAAVAAPVEIVSVVNEFIMTVRTVRPAAITAHTTTFASRRFQITTDSRTDQKKKWIINEQSFFFESLLKDRFCLAALRERHQMKWFTRTALQFVWMRSCWQSLGKHSWLDSVLLSQNVTPFVRIHLRTFIWLN